MNDLEWIRESNLIENVDDSEEDNRSIIAWQQLLDCPWQEATILNLHEMIMCQLRPDIAGKFRTCDVEVGMVTCPPWQEVKTKMREWLWYWNRYPVLRPNAIQYSHVQFEKIHPFEDGNGRVGRMLMNWLRVSRGFEPLLIKAAERQEYYKWFR